ncbi:MAG: methyltransferase domain-containing protein [Candidatus Tectimicrobiota bacterium]
MATTDGTTPLTTRLLHLFQHLGFPRAHIAGRVTEDWSGLVQANPETVGSLTLVCPGGLEAEAVQPVAARLCVISGDTGAPGSAVRQAMASLAQASLVTLRDYFGHTRADLLTDRRQEIGTAMLAFLDRMQQAAPLAPLRLPQTQGEVQEVSYQVQGEGPPLVLLPLGLAASQWQPLLGQLSAHYCTIVLGGAVMGSVASLERRGHSAGYLGVVRTMIEHLQPQPGETILDVGCGSGVLDRWLARYTGGVNRIVATDIHLTLLREAAALAAREGLSQLIEFREGNAEAMPFPDQSFEVTMSATVMELLDADAMLREMIRVTRPGGRVGIVVRAVDMHSLVNLPLRPALRAKVEALPNGLAGPRGCADSSLYRRFCEAGLREVKMSPQLATYSGAQTHGMQERVHAALSPEELDEWQQAVRSAAAAGTFFIALPFHCAVGTRA